MKTLRIRIPAALVALALGLSVNAHAAKNEWDRIDLEGPIEVTLSDGRTRMLEPSCSGGPKPVLNENGDPTGAIEPANTDFFFFVQRGNPNRLLVGLDGGGACWDAVTCIGSPLQEELGVLPPPLDQLIEDSTYTQELDETAEGLAQAGGIFDARNPDNPFANYTKVFIPYCSGDIHWGSKDTEYTLGPITWTIRHRGSDNLLAVVDWLKKNGREAYNIDFDRTRDLMVTGASAGGYGATFAFPYIAELTPRARLNLVSDAAIGVTTTSFFKTAIYDPATGTANWGTEKNLPPVLDEAALAARADSGNPSALSRDVFGYTAAFYPDAKLASLTTNLDLVQVGFYALARLADDPTVPSEQIALEWYTTMATETFLTSQFIPNYRYYIEDGTFHTFIGSDVRTYGPGAEGVPLAEWLRAMTKPGKRTWENLDDGPPSGP
ncbi:pectin acetylesterase-family hydrolase [Lentisalinibacter salinarum]|uniref:pectin acetylesterase-family hydrolase n=1 Tax=Lentisalinibacter salinarum TaxID=2992239 RepID=UPI00386643B8